MARTDKHCLRICRRAWQSSSICSSSVKLAVRTNRQSDTCRFTVSWIVPSLTRSERLKPKLRKLWMWYDGIARSGVAPVILWHRVGYCNSVTMVLLQLYDNVAAAATTLWPGLMVMVLLVCNDGGGVDFDDTTKCVTLKGFDTHISECQWSCWCFNSAYYWLVGSSVSHQIGLHFHTEMALIRLVNASKLWADSASHIAATNESVLDALSFSDVVNKRGSADHSRMRRYCGADLCYAVGAESHKLHLCAHPFTFACHKVVRCAVLVSLRSIITNHLSNDNKNLQALLTFCILYSWDCFFKHTPKS